MTPEEHLANVQRRFDEFVDGILTHGPPTRPWTKGDATALFSGGYDIAAEYVDALVASAKVAVDEATATAYKRRAASLPLQFEFFAETVVSHWRRLELSRPKPKAEPLDWYVSGLISEGKITPEQLRQAREVQKIAPGDLGEIIRDLGFASEREIAAARAASLGLQFIDLTRTPIDPEAIKRVPVRLCRRYNMIPVTLDARSTPNKLLVAAGNVQASIGGIDEIRIASRCQITPVLAVAQDIRDAIDRAYGG